VNLHVSLSRTPAAREGERLLKPPMTERSTNREQAHHICAVGKTAGVLNQARRIRISTRWGWKRGSRKTSSRTGERTHLRRRTFLAHNRGRKIPAARRGSPSDCEHHLNRPKGGKRVPGRQVKVGPTLLRKTETSSSLGGGEV